MTRVLAVTILVASLAQFAFAGRPAVPEIDSSSAVAAVGLLTGALLVLRSRRKR